ncbi:MAG: fructose-bisphosphatase class II [Pelagibacteraceae bacterium TMED287]|nr:MAG: fructose-bisphosphatase class II [Pelagibacteraceae bacterium TMED287]|tara:strand:- start:839 stop:1780 length:942 start_codon:yes stop_codon:yes gene_type:complete
MTIKSEYLNQFIKVTEVAAYGAYPFIGKGDKNAADKGAVDLMRKELNKIDMDASIVIGEGEMDEAPMLYIGEKVGTKKGQKLDIALDPIEGTNFVANNLANSFSIMAVAEKGNLFSAPDTYMEKIAIGGNLPKNLLDLDNSIKENINLLCEAKNTIPEKITACLLKRDRHNKIIEDLQKLKVKINFISDGDVAGAISVIDKNSPIDIYMGIGGGPEGVLAAAALSCLGGQIQTRLVLNEEEKKRTNSFGIKDINKKYNIEELIKGDVVFCATGVTDGDILNGIKVSEKDFEASTFVLHKSSNINKKVKNLHKI